MDLNSGKKMIFQTTDNLTNLDYSRVELGPVTRRRRVKLWLPTANPPRSKWAEIGLPLGKKYRYKMDIVINNLMKKGLL